MPMVEIEHNRAGQHAGGVAPLPTNGRTYLRRALRDTLLQSNYLYIVWYYYTRFY